jgi:integral membrane protein (TIGR00529 family)
MTVWIGFFFAIIVLLILSLKNLGLAMFVGAFILGILTIPESLPTVFLSTITDPSTILLAIIVGLIPIIGETLNKSGQMDNLIRNLRIGKKAFLVISPAIVGVLPMPGGALLSAPLIEKVGKEISNEKKAGLNIWFRHILYLVYPISPAIIISTGVAQVGVYQSIVYLIPILFFSLFLGYFFFIKGPLEKISYKEPFSLMKLVLPLTAILIAPVIDVLIKMNFDLTNKNLSTIIGVTTSLIVAVIIGRINLKTLGKIIFDAKPWNFAFMIFGIMVFLNVFKSSDLLHLIQNSFITKEILFVIAFLLGFGTGRLITPAGIIFPIFLAKFGDIPLSTFALLFFSIFLGYIITPVHPCVSLTIKSLKTNVKDYFKTVLPPTIIALIISFFFLYALSFITV